MITLLKPQKTIETLRALAASGSSGLARKAQAELRERMSEALRTVAEQRATPPEGSKP